MIETPKYGWSKITIGDWSDRCSYIDDVPFKLLETIESAVRIRRPVSVKFDAEGWEYIIIFDMRKIHIVTNDFNSDYKYDTIEISLTDIAKDLIADIRKDLDAWSEWGFNMSEDEISERKKDLSVLCKMIERRL
jgi:hypothetical protein